MTKRAQRELLRLVAEVQAAALRRALSMLRDYESDIPPRDLAALLKTCLATRGMLEPSAPANPTIPGLGSTPKPDFREMANVLGETEGDQLNE